MVLPMGVPAMANLLADEGRSVEIIHLGLERGFSLRRELARLKPRVVALSLHWNQQTRPIIDVAHKIKQWSPETLVVFGGLTASVFARELIGALPFVDAVVRGDGELPLLRLLDAVIDGRGELAEVPNLLWRDAEGVVVVNDERWLLDVELASRLRHGDLGLLRHHSAYYRSSLYADFSQGARGSGGYAGAAYLNAGRGCAHGCIYCGGSASSQLVTAGRQGIMLYPLEKLVEDVRCASEQGATTLRCSFDPPVARRHIGQWFERIGAAGLRLIYDLWALPTTPLLEGVGRHFRQPLLVFSPECGSEALRRQVRPPGFTNTALIEAILEAEGQGIETHCFFSAGLPGERPADVHETVALVARLRDETQTAISATPMVLDPASPIWLEPARYGVTLLRKSLMDFYDEVGLPDGPGYETEHFDEEGIIAAVDRVLSAAELPPWGG